MKDTDFGTPEVAIDSVVELKIDGRQVSVPTGTSILRAAQSIGAAIPKLCARDSLRAYGSCRLCLVEIEGRPGEPASCTTPVAAGMVVNAQTPQLKKLRRGVMELYISDHPHGRSGRTIERCDGMAVRLSREGSAQSPFDVCGAGRMSAERLVSMANQIARFFEAQPEAQAAEQTANYLKSFWDPRMRSDLIMHVRAGGSGVGPTATAAAALLEHPTVLAAPERNPIGSGDGGG